MEITKVRYGSEGLAVVFHPDGDRQMVLDIDSWSDTAIVARIRQSDPGNDLEDIVPGLPGYGPEQTSMILKIINP